MSLLRQALRVSLEEANKDTEKRRKVFVSYHHDNDQDRYEEFSSIFHDIYESVTDNSLDKEIDSDDPVYVMRKIREQYITGTSCTIVLCGYETHKRKYIDWEISATLDKGHGLIGVCLPSIRLNNGVAVVPDRLKANILSKYAIWVGWKEFTSSSENLKKFIEQANSKNKELINNDTELMRKDL